MQTYAQIEELYTFKKVRFYTVHFEEDELSETEKFIREFEDSKYEEDFLDLLAWIKVTDLSQVKNLVNKNFIHTAIPKEGQLAVELAPIV